jgi:regulatory protein
VAAAQADDPAAALAAAVSALAQRDYCSGELALRLTAQGFAGEVVQTALTDLRARRYLDDERYAQQYVANHAERGQGPLRIQDDLQRIGLAAELIDGALEQYAEAQGGWGRLAREVRIRRFGLIEPRGWAQKAKQVRFLQYRGFSTDHIRCALGAGALDEMD